MSLRDTGALFCSAAGLVGGHGAGLTNMLWLAPNDTFVAQIRSPGQGWLYESMASVFQINYTEIPTPDRGGGGYGNVMVDPASVTSHLKPWFEQLNVNVKE